MVIGFPGRAHVANSVSATALHDFITSGVAIKDTRLPGSQWVVNAKTSLTMSTNATPASDSSQPAYWYTDCARLR